MDWPAVFEGLLPELWGKEHFKAYELAPLRRKDVAAAVEAETIDKEAFFSELNRTESVPLAIKPITLGFLLSVFSSQGRFPNTRQELYELGGTKLCEEPNPNRQDLYLHGGAGDLSATQRLAVASRIAAIGIFCRRPTIFTGPLAPTQSGEEVLVSSLAGGDEHTGPSGFMVSEDAIREVLGTGLFSSRGPHRMGFAHQTYAEFLASRYLTSHSVTSEKVISLLRHPDDPDGYVVPQLYETAAWIAGMNKDVLWAIATVDPQVLLRGDVGNLMEADRGLIVDSLLQALDDQRANDRDWDVHRHYSKLEHDGLADQLRPWITDKGKHIVARDVAIDIAEACKLQELQSLLADVALDQDEVERLRDSAAHALAKIGDGVTRQRLRPLAIGQAGEDPRDQLKGNALRSLWPDLISAEELFRNLTPPKRQNFHGAYSSFLGLEMLQHLTVDDLPHALRWLKDLASQGRMEFPGQRLADEIIIKAWRNMSTVSVLKALAETSDELLRNYHDLIQDRDKKEEHAELFDDPDARRTVGKAIIALGSGQHKSVELTCRWPRLIRLEDFEWCVEWLLESLGCDTEPMWADLVWRLFCWGEPSSERLDLVIASRAKSSVLEKESELFFTPVEIGSERAQKMIKQQQDYLECQREPKPRVLDLLPRDRIDHCLTRFENGDFHAWWGLLQEMTLEDTSTRYGVVPVDVHKLPGWASSDNPTRSRILAAAEQYLAIAPVDPLKWVRQPHNWSTSDIAGYVALYLLKAEAPASYENLPTVVWRRHASNVICAPSFDADDTEKQHHEELALRAYQQAPDEFIFCLLMQLDAEGRDERSISWDRRLKLCWDENLKRSVHDKLVESMEHWSPESFDDVATLLLEQDYGPIKGLLIGLVTGIVKGSYESRQLALIAAAGLVRYTDDAAWLIIWPAIQADRDFGCELMMNIAHGLHHNTREVVRKLSEGQVADLYIWLVREFPYSEDREHDSVYTASKDDSVREFRNDVMGFLETMGTPAAVQELEQIAATFPELVWLGSVVVEARRNSLRQTWHPPSPEEFLSFVSQPNVRLVRDADELQDVLVEALSALERKLQGEIPAAPDLWDQVDRMHGSEKYRPKDENHLSDWVKRNLEAELGTRGIVCARDVQIRRGEGSGTGEKTDIHVTAVVPGLQDGAFEQVRVIIETRGCWNRELKTAMQTQLVDRYLKDNQCRHGIYLVGWYCCDQWNDGDYRKGKVPNWSLQEARKFFDAKTQQGSLRDVRVKAIVLNTALR